MSGAEHVAQIAPARAVPQLEQKRPIAGAPQDGHGFAVVSSDGVVDGLGGEVMGGK
ncbi:MAG: hypothetical protein ABJE10_18645 [bacterium]